MATRKQARVDQRSRGAREQGRDGRAALLEAALEVFAERGYRAASVDEVAERAGYSKGALYWHFGSKEELFWALLEERVERPWREGIALLESASADRDMAPEASRRFVEMLRGERELLAIEHEYWSLAVRDPTVRRRYAKRRGELRKALGKAIAARAEHLGAPPFEDPDAMATVFICLASGLVQERMVDPRAVPDDLLGETLALIYAGHLARTSGG